MISYRYWRIKSFDSSDNEIDLSEIEFKINGVWVNLSSYSIFNLGSTFVSGFGISSLNDNTIETVDNTKVAKVTGLLCELDVYFDLTVATLVESVRIAPRVQDIGRPSSISIYGGNSITSWVLIDSFTGIDNSSWVRGWWKEFEIRYPYIISKLSGTSTVGQRFDYQITCSNFDYVGFIGFEADNLPAGLTLDAQSGRISGDLGITYPSGVYSFNIRAVSSTGTDQKTITVYHGSKVYNEGNLASITALETVTLSGNITYVWKFWDNTKVTSTKSYTKYLNKDANCEFTILVCNEHGTSSTLNSSLYVNDAPDLVQITKVKKDELVPGYVTLTLVANDFNENYSVDWYAENGNFLASGTTYDHYQTQEIEILTAKVTDNFNAQNEFRIPIYGIKPELPVISQIGQGLSSPTILPSNFTLDYATTREVDFFSNIHIDEATLNGTSITPGTITSGYKATILVKDQTDKKQNGLYETYLAPARFKLFYNTVPTTEKYFCLIYGSSITFSYTTYGLTQGQQFYDRVFQPGLRFMVKGEDGSLIATVSSTTIYTDKITVTFTDPIYSGTLIAETPVHLYKEWTRLITPIFPGTLFLVTGGVINGGVKFVTRTLLQNEQVIPGITEIDFIKSNITTKNTVSNGEKINLSATIYDTLGQQIDYDWVFWDGVVLSGTTTGGNTAYVANVSKLVSETFPGLKNVILTARNKNYPKIETSMITQIEVV